MNNVFNISRFANLFKKHTTEHYKGYLMSLAVLMGILLAFCSFFAYVAKSAMTAEAQFGIYIVFMLVAGTIFTSGVFSDLSETKKAIATLTLPASHFEKFVVKWLYSYLVFGVLYTCIFYTVMIPISSAAVEQGGHVALLNIFRADNLSDIFISYTLAHAITFLGAIIFKKMHFIKTGFVMMGIFIVIVTANKWIMEGLIGRKISGAFPFINFDFTEDTRTVLGNTSTNYNIALHNSSSTISGHVLVIAITLLFWAAAYSRLKEKQV